MAAPSALHGRLRALIARIPKGRVATYGQVAGLAGSPGAARQVGRFLFQLPEGDALPWHRIINSKGEISYHPARRGADEWQRTLLESEGVAFDDAGRVDLARHLWNGKAR